MMTQKQYTELLSPVLKLQAASEATDKKVESVLVGVVALVKNSSSTSNEMKIQTGLLTDIRDILREIKDKSVGKGAGKGAAKGMSLGGAIKVGMFMVISAAALAAASYFMKEIYAVAPMQLLTAIGISLALIPITSAFIKIYQTLKPVQSLAQRAGGFALDKMGAGRAKPMSTKSALGMTFVIIIASVLAIVMASYLLQVVGTPSMTQLGTAFLIGLALQPMTLTFATLVRALKRAGIRPNKQGLKMLAMTGLALIVMVGAIAGIAMALTMLPPSLVEPPEIMWVLQTGFMLWVFSFSFAKVIKATRGMTIKQIIMAALVYPLMALAIVGIATIFNYFGGKYENSPPPLWSFQTAFSLALFSIGYVLLVKSLRRASIKDMIKGAAAAAFVALSVVAVAWMFQYLVGDYQAPPAEWSFKAGLALAVFGIGYVILTKTVGKLSIKDLMFGVIGVAAVAIAILATAWIFSILPGSYMAPDMGWSLSAMVAIILFAIPVGIIGAIIMATGGTGLAAIALGVVGMIIIAAGILAVAWIFSYIPADKLAAVAKGLTEALLAPLNGIVDVLVRIKNEIGVEALIPLAVGIIAISVSLIALAAATASVAAGGLFSSIAGVGEAFFGSVAEFFGGERKKGPMEILKELVGMAPQIGVLSASLTTLAKAFGKIIGRLNENNISRIVRGVNAFILKNETMKNKNGYTVSGYFKAYPAFLRNVAAGYTSIAKAQSGMDIEILEKTTEMIKALAYLNEVGGDNAMAKLGESLVNAVKELKEMLSGFGGKIDQNTAASKEGAGAIKKVADKIGGAGKPGAGKPGAGGKAGSPAGKFDSEDVVDAIEALERTIIKLKGVS